MNKLKLKLCLTEDNKPQHVNFSDAYNSSRKYRSLKIEMHPDRSWKLVDLKTVNVMQQIGSQLRYLELKSSFLYVDDALLAKAFFESMPQLEDLTVHHFSLRMADEDDISKIEPVNMKKLKSVIVRQSAPDVSIAQIGMNFMTYCCPFFSSLNLSRRRKS